MSIAASARNAYAVDAEARATEFRQAASNPEVQSALEKITQWIPSEAVALYITLVGLLALSGSTDRWILFGFGVLSVIVFVCLNTALINKEGADKWKADNNQGPPPKMARKRFIGLLGVSTFSFAVWALALPDTPFLSVTDKATQIGGVLVIATAALMPKIAGLLDLKVKS